MKRCAIGAASQRISVGDLTGNRDILRECCESVYHTDSDSYAFQIIEGRTRRAAIEKANEIIRVARDDAADPPAVRAADVGQRSRPCDGPTRPTTSPARSRQRLGALDFAEDRRGSWRRTTGLAFVDHYTAGLRSDLYVVAGRPGMGKSALALRVYRQPDARRFARVQCHA